MRLSGLGAALTFAKDCMADCSQQVGGAKSLGVYARDKSDTLIVKTGDDQSSAGEFWSAQCTFCLVPSIAHW